MAKKPTIRNIGVVGNPAGEIGRLWNNYKATGDPELLAQICEQSDFVGIADIGKTIANRLRKTNRNKRRYADELFWNEGMKLFDLISKQLKWKDASIEARCLYVAETLGAENAPFTKGRDQFADGLRKRLKDRGRPE